MRQVTIAGITFPGRSMGQANLCGLDIYACDLEGAKARGDSEFRRLLAPALPLKIFAL